MSQGFQKQDQGQQKILKYLEEIHKYLEKLDALLVAHPGESSRVNSQPQTDTEHQRAPEPVPIDTESLSETDSASGPGTFTVRRQNVVRPYLELALTPVRLATPPMLALGLALPQAIYYSFKLLSGVISHVWPEDELHHSTSNSRVNVRSRNKARRETDEKPGNIPWTPDAAGSLWGGVGTRRGPQRLSGAGTGNRQLHEFGSPVSRGQEARNRFLPTCSSMANGFTKVDSQWRCVRIRTACWRCGC